MTENKLTGLSTANPALAFNEKPLVSTKPAPKAEPSKRSGKDKVVLGAKVAGRLAKKGAAMMIPLGYRKLYRGEKLNKYDWIRTVSTTAIYAGGIVVGGPVGLAIVTGGRAVNYGSLGVQFRNELANLAKGAGRKLDPRKLASAIKDGSAKKALSKLAHPKALAAAGVGAVTTLASSGLAAAVNETTKNGHHQIYFSTYLGYGDTYNGMDIEDDVSVPIRSHDTALAQHAQIYAQNHTDPVLISATTSDDYVVQAHAELYAQDPTNSALAAATASDKYVVACHQAIAAQNPTDPALVFSPTTDQYVASAQSAYDVSMDAQVAQEAANQHAANAAQEHQVAQEQAGSAVSKGIDFLKDIPNHPLEIGVLGVIGIGGIALLIGLGKAVAKNEAEARQRAAQGHQKTPISANSWAHN